MDPIQVAAGSWTWPGGGSYFGIPIGNFVGWILVTIIATGSFRIYEYFKPAVIVQEIKSIYIIPVLGYGLIYLSFLSSAISFNMMSLALVGSLTMLPIVMGNLFLFTNYHKK